MHKKSVISLIFALVTALVANLSISMAGNASTARSKAEIIRSQPEVQRVGIVVAYIPEQSITIVDRDGVQFAFELASPLKIVPASRAHLLAPGAFVTIISPNNVPDGKQIAEGVVVHPGIPPGFPIPTSTYTPLPIGTTTPTATPVGITPSLTETTIPTETPAGVTASPTATPIAARTATSSPTLPVGNLVLVGAGDIASCGHNNDEATAKLLDNIPGTVFTAGDNVYPDGTYDQFVNCYGPTWGRHKDRTEPAPGNHDYNTSGAAGYFQYFNNPPAYYAYTLGAWRIYALNSELDVSAGSPQITWLQSDLSANPSQCALAYWHKPRWSSGTVHGSNSSMQTLWQVLYAAGAELVINGHEHNYERFAPMNASGAAVSQGLREIVAGTGGAGLYPFGTILPTSQVRNNSTFGVLKLTLHSTGYDWQFTPIAGMTFTDSGSDSCH